MTDPNDTLPDDYAFMDFLQGAFCFGVVLAIAAVLQGLGIIDLSVWQGLETVN